MVGLQGLWVSWPGRQVDRPFWVLGQAWSSLDCLEMAREMGGNRMGWEAAGSCEVQVGLHGGWIGVTLEDAVADRTGEAYLIFSQAL